MKQTCEVTLSEAQYRSVMGAFDRAAFKVLHQPIRTAVPQSLPRPAAKEELCAISRQLREADVRLHECMERSARRPSRQMRRRVESFSWMLSDCLDEIDALILEI